MKVLLKVILKQITSVWQHIATVLHYELQSIKADYGSNRFFAVKIVLNTWIQSVGKVVDVYVKAFVLYI
jgi:hypothetical protein